MEGTPPMSSYEDETGVKLIIIIIIIIIQKWNWLQTLTIVDWRITIHSVCDPIQSMIKYEILFQLHQNYINQQTKIEQN